MDPFAVALHRSISDHLCNQHEISAVKLDVDALSQVCNLCTIQQRHQGNSGGNMSGQQTAGSNTIVYATGMRLDLNLYKPLNWDDVEEHIALQPFFVECTQQEQQPCPIEQLKNCELRIGSRILRFDNATRTMCASLHPGRARFYYIFENFLPARDEYQSGVEVVVVLYFTLKQEVVEARNLSMHNMEREEFFDSMNPTRFTEKDLEESVSFDHLSFTGNFGGSDVSDEEGTDD